MFLLFPELKTNSYCCLINPMKKKYYLVLIFFIILFYLSGCKSVTYDYQEPTQSDTLKVTKTDSTGHIHSNKSAAPVKNYFIRSSPGFTLQINGNYNIGLSELNANLGTNQQVFQFEDGQNFGTRNGFGFYVTGKKPFMNYDNVRLVFIGAANFFSNYKFSSRASDDGKIKYQVFSLGAGFENSFTPSFKIKPYLGAAVLINAITGQASYINDDTVFTDVTFKPSFRVGVTLSAGMEYLFSDKIGWNFGVSVTSANLLFKQSHISDNTNEVYVRDRRRSDMKLFLSGYKQFLFTSFYSGINIYFGIKEKSFRF